MSLNEAHVHWFSRTHHRLRRGPRNPDLALAARTDACILLTGPGESAQDLAYRLHVSGGWRHGAFTIIDCASREPGLEAELMRELFGYSPPADAAPLRLVQAGTVLLQEINRLPLPVQRRLAGRLSEEWTSPAPGRSRRRLIASTSEPLFDRVLAGTFDDSLYYRINVIHFAVPLAE